MSARNGVGCWASASLMGLAARLRLATREELRLEVGGGAGTSLMDLAARLWLATRETGVWASKVRGASWAVVAVALVCVGALPAQAGRVRPHIECDTPSAASEVTYAPLDLLVNMSQQAIESTLAVSLNGTNVTSLFTLKPPAAGRQKATASHVWGGIVLPGTNQWTASVQVNGETKQCQASFQAVGDPYVDAVASYTIGTNGGYPGTQYLPGVVKGPPKGSGLFQGGLDVFSLGFGGSIVLRFDDNAIADGDGPDFTVFENAFMAFNAATLTIERPFADPGRVSVSQDGVTWYEFPCSLTTNPALGIFYPGCAGVYPVLSNANDPSTPHASIPTAGTIGDLIGEPVFPPPAPGGAGGDSFDLADLGLAWARYVRIVDPNFVTGDPYGPNNAGVDVDAVAAIHSVPATDANGNGVPDAVE
jgi:hypothetical protein